MEPSVDLVCILRETPFSKWKEEDKREILSCSPPQPILTYQPKTGSVSGKLHTRNFQKSWYTSYPWLCGSKYLQKLYCWPCLIVGVKQGVWNNTGFENLSCATRSFHKHEGSSEHIKNAVGYKELKKNLNRIADALKENARLCIAKFNENVRLNRLFMRLPIDAVLFLSKQELAFRGHNESFSSLNRGNFKELLNLLISNSSLELQQHYAKIKTVFSGESKTIQNELIDCIYSYIKDTVKNEISEAQFFSVQVDDTTDITKQSQCSIIIRYVDSKGSLVERFLGFHDVSSDRTANALFCLLQTVLNEFSYKTKLIAQCYDGASVMAGHLNGLQMKVKEEAPQAVFVHCLAHRLNLVLKQSTNTISECRIFFSSLGGIPSFFHLSAKRTFVADSVIAKRIPSGVDIRWSSHGKLLNVVVEEWDGLKEIFEKLMNDAQSDEKTIRQSKGFLNEFNSFSFAFFAIVFNDIFQYMNILFNVLQKKSLDINFCLSKINSTQHLIVHKRNDDTFKMYYDMAQEKCKIELKRQPNLQTEEQVFHKYKMLYFEILDLVSTQIETRFQDTAKLQFLCLGDSSKFEKFSETFPLSALQNLKTCYPSLFDIHRLKNELEYIYCDAKYKNINLEDIILSLNNNEMKEVFKEAYRLFCLIITIPSTSSSVERSFSCLKRIKTYLRNSTSQERLTALATISLEKSLLNDIMKTVPFYEDIIDKFAALKDRRIDLIYKQ